MNTVQSKKQGIGQDIANLLQLSKERALNGITAYKEMLTEGHYALTRLKRDFIKIHCPYKVGDYIEINGRVAKIGSVSFCASSSAIDGYYTLFATHIDSHTLHPLPQEHPIRVTKHDSFTLFSPSAHQPKEVLA